MPKSSMTQQEFETKMTEKYGNVDFSTMTFKLSKTTINCPKCGNANTKSAIRHIECTCSNCFSNMSQRSSNEIFIEKVENKFGAGKFKFDKLNYHNAKTPVELFCTEHNDYFTVVPNKMLCGHGCNVCNRNHAHTTESFIAVAKKNYGEDAFSFDKTVYVNQKTKVTLHCNAGNHEWIVDPKSILTGKTGCGVCSHKSGFTSEQFINSAIEVHGEKYDYSNVVYTGSGDKIIIECGEHGLFEQTPKAHLTGRGCPKCGKYGYQQTQPGYFYIQKLTNENKTVYKYGITGDMKRRVHEQSRDSVFEHEVLVEMYFEDGKKPMALESLLKNYIESGVTSTEELPSGFSETFDEKYLDEVLSIVNNFR